MAVADQPAVGVALLFNLIGNRLKGLVLFHHVGDLIHGEYLAVVLPPDTGGQKTHFLNLFWRFDFPHLEIAHGTNLAFYIFRVIIRIYGTF